MYFIQWLVSVVSLFGEPAANLVAWKNPLLAWSLLDYGTFCPTVFSVLVAVAAICNDPSAIATAVGVLLGGLRIVKQLEIMHTYSQDGAGGVVRRLITPACPLYTWANSWYCRLSLHPEGKIATILLVSSPFLQSQPLPYRSITNDLQLSVATLTVLHRLGLPIVFYSLGLYAAFVNSSGEPAAICHYHGDTFISAEPYRKLESQIQKFWCDGERDGLDIMDEWRTAKESHLYVSISFAQPY